jgi:hypothetical protein
VSDQRPCCIHLNNLFHDSRLGPRVIRPHQSIITDHAQDVLDDYNVAGTFTEIHHHMHGGDDHTTPIPNGDVLLWKGTTLKIKVKGYVANTYCDFYIVKEKRQKYMLDPWRAEETSQRAHHMPYTLEQWRMISGPFTAQSVNKQQYDVISHKRIFMNSARSISPGDVAAEAVDMAHSEIDPTTRNEKLVFFNLRPNKVLKVLDNSMSQMTGQQDFGIDADPNQDKTIGPWTYDNQNPYDNWWLICTTTDEGGDIATPAHRMQMQVIRTNYWRDKLDDSKRRSTGRNLAQSRGLESNYTGNPHTVLEMPAYVPDPNEDTNDATENVDATDILNAQGVM